MPARTTPSIRSGLSGPSTVLVDGRVCTPATAPAPVRVTEPKLVSVVVGDVPTSPAIVVGPAFVIPAPDRRAKLNAVPRPNVVGSALAVRPVMAPIAMMSAMPTFATTAFELIPETLPRALMRVVPVSVGWSTKCLSAS